MEVFDAFALNRSAQKLAHWKQVAFMLMCCERMLANYRTFSLEAQFGDVAELRQALDVAWDWAESGSLPPSLDARIVSCEKQAPDTERFKSIYTSAALDAAACVCIVLDSIKQPAIQHVVDVASLARDTVDLFVQELVSLEIDSPESEEVIAQHPLMQAELRRQREDMAVVAAMHGERSAHVRRLRSAASSTSGSLKT